MTVVAWSLPDSSSHSAARHIDALQLHYHLFGADHQTPHHRHCLGPTVINVLCPIGVKTTAACTVYWIPYVFVDKLSGTHLTYHAVRRGGSMADSSGSKGHHITLPSVNNGASTDRQLDAQIDGHGEAPSNAPRCGLAGHRTAASSCGDVTLRQPFRVRERGMRESN